MAYCSLADVTTLMGDSMSAEAEDAAAALLEGASDFVDRYTGRSFTSGTVTGEVHPVYRGQITLDTSPIASITTLTVTSPYIGAVPVTMLADTGYQILDASRGLVLVAGSDNDRATVTYVTALGAVPDDIKTATAMLVAYWSRSATDATALIFSKIKAGSAELTYREVTQEVPFDVKAILDGYRPAFAFA